VARLMSVSVMAGQPVGVLQQQRSQHCRCYSLGLVLTECTCCTCTLTFYAFTYFISFASCRSCGGTTPGGGCSGCLSAPCATSG
jgi:hypothetical protein